MDYVMASKKNFSSSVLVLVKFLLMILRFENLSDEKFFNDKSVYQAKCHILTTVIKSVLGKKIQQQNKKCYPIAFT